MFQVLGRALTDLDSLHVSHKFIVEKDWSQPSTRSLTWSRWAVRAGCPGGTGSSSSLSSKRFFSSFLLEAWFLVAQVEHKGLSGEIKLKEGMRTDFQLDVMDKVRGVIIIVRRDQAFYMRCISWHLPWSVSQWVCGGLVVISHFWDSYRIYRACELVDV